MSDSYGSGSDEDAGMFVAGVEVENLSGRAAQHQQRGGGGRTAGTSSTVVRRAGGASASLRFEEGEEGEGEEYFVPAMGGAGVGEEEVQQEEEEGEEDEFDPSKSARMKDIALMIFINFLSFVCFCIVLPSLWPYIQTFGKSKSYVGWAVAVNSAGTFFASPLLGKWADWRGVKEAIFFSLLLMVGGNVMYAMAVDVWMLLLSRFIVGAAAANYAPATTYLSYATHPKHRTLVMTLNSAAGILGFICGPALAAALGFINVNPTSWLQFNAKTTPGWASVVLSVFCLVFLPTFKDMQAKKVATKTIHHRHRHLDSEDDTSDYMFDHELQPKDVQASVKEYHSSNRSNPLGARSHGESMQSLKDLMSRPNLPYLSIAICLYLQFVLYTAFTVFETIGTPYTENAYGWSVTQNGYLFAGIGGACILAMLLLQVFGLCLRDRALLLGNMIVMVIGFGLLVNYPFDANVEIVRFMFGVFLASIGFAAACAILISIFSKLLGDAEQGLMMGWLSAVGSFARIIGPVAASYVLDFVGGSLVFLCTAILVLTGLLASILGWRMLRTKDKMDYAKEEEERRIAQEERRKRRTEYRSRLREKREGRRKGEEEETVGLLHDPSGSINAAGEEYFV